jgi:hypothetical protein
VQSLELNRAYYRDCVAPVLRAHCPAIAGRHAAALLGWGSEVLGNDDDYSKRYGWGPRVALFLTAEDHPVWAERVAEALERHVPPRFLGQPTRFTDPTAGPPIPTLAPGGVLQIPIVTCARLAGIYLGLPRADLTAHPLSSRDWLFLPEGGLLRMTAGEVYHDGVGELSALRAYLRYFPGDVWRYRLAYGWTALGWDVDLVALCAHRGDTLSARLAAAESVRRIVGLIFLLNRVYKPGYPKWLHRQFYKLPHLAAELGPVLEAALSAADPMRADELLWPAVERLVAFQRERAGLPEVAYKRPVGLGWSAYTYDLGPVVEALRATIDGELRALPFPIGAPDQWIADQDLLMVPSQLRSLAGIYDSEDPVRVLFRRDRWDRFL